MFVNDGDGGGGIGTTTSHRRNFHEGVIARGGVHVARSHHGKCRRLLIGGRHPSGHDQCSGINKEKEQGGHKKGLLPQPRLPTTRGSRLRPSRPNPRLEGGSPSNSRGIGIPQNNNKNGTSVRTGSSFKLRGFLLELYLGVCLGVCARFIRLVSVTSTRPVHVPSFVFPCTSITSL